MKPLIEVVSCGLMEIDATVPPSHDTVGRNGKRSTYVGWSKEAMQVLRISALGFKNYWVLLAPSKKSSFPFISSSHSNCKFFSTQY